MKKIVILNGSPRKTGNTAALINHFIFGAKQNANHIDVVKIDELNLNFCTGCLRCNILERCGQTDDDWEKIIQKMDDADVIVFASPIYFHHVSAQMKKLIDRFRSLVKVKITETGLIYKPIKQWNKEIALFFSMGSSDDSDAKPAIEMFQFFFDIISPDKKLHIVKGTRLTVRRQLDFEKNALKRLYEKMGLPKKLADSDYLSNQNLAKRCFNLGKQLSE